MTINDGYIKSKYENDNCAKNDDDNYSAAEYI